MKLQAYNLDTAKGNGGCFVEFLGTRYPVEPDQTSVKIEGVVFQVAPADKPVEPVIVKPAEPKPAKKTQRKTAKKK